MTDLIQSLVLGIVQGLSEFLPISSTAHLILIPYFMEWKDFGLSFDVALHLGTLIAVLSFFWKDWINIFVSAKYALKNKGLSGFKNEMLFFLMVGTIPAILFGYFFEQKAETVFRSPLLIAFTLIFAGALLYWADKKFKGKKNITGTSLKDSIVIGLAQAIAIIPGVSRSGATITAGLCRGFDKINAARFSFLLSAPIIAGAAFLKLPYLFKDGINVFIIAGMLSSAISGFLAIKYLLKYLEKWGYGIFFFYRAALGLVILLFYLLKS